VFPAKFAYHRAETLEDAIRLLGEHDEAKPLAGGQSLLPMMKLRLAEIPHIVDIGRIESLAGIDQVDGAVRIGALVTHAGLTDSGTVRGACPLLAEAAGRVADIQVRNRGTIGGNLAHADPASDLPAAVLALGATLRIAGSDGERDVAASDFFHGLFTTEVGEGEVLAAIDVPTSGAGTGAAYLKHEHPASGFAVCGAAAVVSLDDDGACRSARLCFNGVTYAPHDASAVTDALAGERLGDDAIERAVEARLAIENPSSDLYASGSWRIALAKVLGRRALERARDRARG